MKGYAKKLFRSDRIWVFYFCILLALLLIETVLGRGLFPEVGLVFPASYNSFIQSVWFCELISFILLPIILLFLPGIKLGKKLVPWLMSAVVSLAVCAFFVGAQSNDCSTNVSSGVVCEHRSLNYTLRRSLRYHAYDSHDYMLESIAPSFVVLQIPFVVGGILSALGLWLYAEVHKR